MPPDRPFGDIAPFACRPENSRGRRFAEPESSMRSAFQRDRDRILHSAAFRRLKHKTQVFVYHEGDYYRTRLTHSLEVAQITRSLCRYLGLNEDLGEALALAHDLGHPPFGHAGEDALKACMAPYGGFDHNAQSLRLLSTLEQRYGAFDGLNLTWETLEGVAKHNGPLLPARTGHPLDETLAAFNATFDLELDSFAGAEAQIAAISDDIAYNNHDIDDGVRAGVFALEELREVPMVAHVMDEVLADFPRLAGSRLKHETVRRLIDLMVRDLVAETIGRVAALQPASAQDVRQMGQPLVQFSATMAAGESQLKAFLFKHMYRHYKVRAMADAARAVVRDLFDSYMGDPTALPPEWQELVVRTDTAQAARHICDFIAGMTDRFALREHVRLIGPSALTDEHF